MRGSRNGKYHIRVNNSFFQFKIELFPRMLYSLRSCITAECEETCHFVEDNEHSFELRLRGVLEVVDVTRNDLSVGDQVALAVNHVRNHHHLTHWEDEKGIRHLCPLLWSH